MNRLRRDLTRLLPSVTVRDRRIASAMTSRRTCAGKVCQSADFTIVSNRILASRPAIRAKSRTPGRSTRCCEPCARLLPAPKAWGLAISSPQTSRRGHNVSDIPPLQLVHDRPCLPRVRVHGAGYLCHANGKGEEVRSDVLPRRNGAVTAGIFDRPDGAVPLHERPIHGVLGYGMLEVRRSVKNSPLSASAATSYRSAASERCITLSYSS
jgi:hypothetical protein